MLTLVTSLSSSNFTYSLLWSQTVKLESPTDLRVCQSINLATTHEVVAKQHANLW